MKILLFILVAGCIVGVFFFRNEKVKNVLPITLLNEGEVTLRVGEETQINNFKVKVLEILEDSRCPVDVTCIQAGKVSFKVFYDSGTRTETFIVNSNGNPYAFGMYSFYVGNIEPLTQSSKNISPEDYRITLHLKRLPTPLE